MASLIGYVILIDWQRDRLRGFITKKIDGTRPANSKKRKLASSRLPKSNLKEDLDN